MYLQVSYLVAPKMVMMMSPTKCISRRTTKGKGKKNDDNKYAVVSFNYSSMSMTNYDHKSFINVPTGKLPHFDGTNFAK
jgi:hypothetical protein